MWKAKSMQKNPWKNKIVKKNFVELLSKLTIFTIYFETPQKNHFNQSEGGGEAKWICAIYTGWFIIALLQAERYCRRCGVAGGERVPLAPLGLFSSLFSINYILTSFDSILHFLPDWLHSRTVPRDDELYGPLDLILQLCQYDFWIQIRPVFFPLPPETPPYYQGILHTTCGPQNFAGQALTRTALQMLKYITLVILAFLTWELFPLTAQPL